MGRFMAVLYSDKKRESVAIRGAYNDETDGLIFHCSVMLLSVVISYASNEIGVS